MSLSPTEKKLTKSSVGSIGLGLLTLLTCELPIIFGVIGLGSLSTQVSAFKPPYWLETMAISFALIGIFVLTGLFIRHRGFKKMFLNKAYLNKVFLKKDH